MGLFRRKQGRAATTRAMSRFTEGEREQGMNMLEATEDVFVDLRAPSRLGATLFTAATGDLDKDDPMFGMVAAVSLMGYSCRMAHAADKQPDDHLATAIAAQLLVGESGKVDHAAQDPARLIEVLHITAELADDPAAIAGLSGVEVGAWNAFATTATYQLHKNFVASGQSRRALPSPEAIENLLRLGYAIRIVDEIAGEHPVTRNDLAEQND